MINQIRIAVRGAGTLPLDAFTEFQGELKSLSKIDYERLKNEIITQGFSFTIHVWICDGTNYILDGHQRLRTVKKMVKEGWECPELPISIVEAESYEQAKHKLLGATSQYGKMENDGLLEYMQDAHMTPETLVNSFRFAELDVQKFVQSNFDSYTPTTTVEEHERKLPDGEIQTQYIISVHLGDEPTMKALYEELHNRGFECKLIT